MENTKASLRKLLSEGKLLKTKDAAMAYASSHDLEEMESKLTVLSSQIEELQRNSDSGTLSNADYSLRHAQLTRHLNALINRLPNEALLSSKKRKLVSDNTFKKWFMWGLIIAKVVVILRLIRHWRTGGFNAEQLGASITLLIPSFAGFLAIILGAYLLEQRKDDSTPPRYFSASLLRFTLLLLPIYAFILIFLLELKTSSTLSFAMMAFYIAMVESVLGGFIGQIVYSVFTQKND